MKFPFSTADLNAMTVEQRKDLLSGGFSRWRMEQAARYIAPFWWVAPLTSRFLLVPSILKARNGTAFFAEINGALFCITAAHVYRGYLEAKARYPKLVCRLGEGGVTFEPQAHLCNIGNEGDLDIATFHITRKILTAIGKEAVTTPSYGWPPQHPRSGQECTMIGYPAKSTFWLSQRELSFGIYCASGPIGTASDRQITMPFDRQSWVDVAGRGLPPRGMDLGGISGGPVLILTEQNKDWTFAAGGVISEMPSSPHYELIIAEPVRFIGEGGEVLSENSAPLRRDYRMPGDS